MLALIVFKANSIEVYDGARYFACVYINLRIILQDHSPNDNNHDAGFIGMYRAAISVSTSQPLIGLEKIYLF